MHVMYRVYLASANAAAVATEQLAQAGFAVDAQPPDATGVALQASITDEIGRADEALGQALSGVDHDPVIEWHASRLTGFV
jgi:hypothetical protein